MKKVILIIGGIIVLITIIVIAGGGEKRETEPEDISKSSQVEKLDCHNIYFGMGAGDEEGPPGNQEEQKKLCGNRLKDFIQIMISKEVRKENIWYKEWQKYKDFDFTNCNCKFVKASAVEEGLKIEKFVSQWNWTCYFDCCELKGKPEAIMDKCNVGKDIVSASERSHFPCEETPNCEWRPLGCELGPTAGEKKCYFACCPKNLTFSDETRSIYGRCFILID